MSAPLDQSPHNVELQSLRGIAAVAVMVHHSFRTLLPQGNWAWHLSEVPLNAQGAVIVFFVLSGYVLGRSLLRRGLDARGVVTFYVRRAFRIYPALWAGLALGSLYLIFVQPIEAPQMAEWARAHYNPAGAGWLPVLESVAGVGNYLLPTAWTITVELCASFLLPLLVWLAARRRRLMLPAILLLAALCAISGPALRNVPFYLVDFALGVALCFFVPPPWFTRSRLPLAFGAAAVLLFVQLLPAAGAWYWSLSLAQGVAAAVLIAGLVAGPTGWLRHRWLVATGDWSYSIYLLHLPIAYTLTRLALHAGIVGADSSFSPMLIAALTAAITFPLSALVFHYIERPGIAAGTALLRRWNAPERHG